MTNEKKIISGQNVIVNASVFEISVNCSMEMLDSNDIDVSAFLLNSGGKVSKDNDFIFYNNPKSESQCIHLNSDNPEVQFFTLDLSKVSLTVKKIAFVLTIPVGFSFAKQLSIGIKDILSFEPETKQMKEKSLVLGELYVHNNNWKFRALGMGFQGGLSPLAMSYGVEIDDEKPEQKVPTEKTITQSKSPSQLINASKAEDKKIDLIKSTVNLKKSGEKTTINLSKGSQVKEKLVWQINSDLDLYCFYVNKDDKEDKIYYKNLGCLDRSPYIKLLGDSQYAGEEMVEISRPENVKYALLAAYSALSNGIGSFYSYKAKIIVSDSDNQEIVSHLSHKDPYSYWVAFAVIDFTVPGKLSIKNVETYSNKKTFTNQFLQRTGEKPSSLFHTPSKSVNGVNSYDPEKSPYLFKDGSFMMSVGVREFK